MVSVVSLSTVVTISCAIILPVLQQSVKAEQQLSSHSISADPTFVRVIGNFDPRNDDVYFISALQITFEDYYQTYADTLYGFDIAAIFLYAATVYEFQPTTATNESTMITSWCEIQTTFSVPIDHFDQSTFTTDIATQFVMDFFLIYEQNSTKLRSRLSKRNNFTITAIEAFAVSSDIVRTELEGYVNNYSNTGSSSSKSNNALTILAGISGAIIGLALIALLISTFKRSYVLAKDDNTLGIRRLENSKTTMNGSTTNPDEMSSDIENERNIDQLGDGDLIVTASNYPDQTYSDIECECEDNNQPDHTSKAFYNDVNNSKKVDPPIVSSDSFGFDVGNDDDDDDDDDETVVTRNQVSPTVSHYNNNSPTTNDSSPVWSMFSGNSSTDQTTSPYSTEEHLTKRYRWHESDIDDEVHVSHLLSLPEEPPTGSPRCDSSCASCKHGIFNKIKDSDTTSNSTSNDM